MQASRELCRSRCPSPTSPGTPAQLSKSTGRTDEAPHWASPVTSMNKGEMRAAGDLERFVWSFADQLRRYEYRNSAVMTALALDAAQYWSSRTSLPLPASLHLTNDRAAQIPLLPVDRQRRWLEAANDEALKSYLPALAYAIHGDGGGEYFSSASINRVGVVAALAGLRPRDEPLTVLDLAAGSGSTLLSMAQELSKGQWTPRLLGQDFNQDAAMLASATLFIEGVDGDVRTANSLTTDCFARTYVDFAVSQPPFGLSWKSMEREVRQRHADDGWYPFGLPLTSDSTWLFVSRMLEKLKPPAMGGGRAVVFAALGALQGAGNDNVRSQLLEQDLLEAVVGLPSGLSPNTNIPLYALVFANAKSPSRAGKVQVVNLRPYFQTSSNRRSTARALREEAFSVLSAALRTVKPGVASRTVPTEFFLRRRFQAVSGFDATASTRPDKWTWDVEVPASEDAEKSLARRYGPEAAVVWQDSCVVRSRLEIDSLFDETHRRFERWLKAQSWSATRLSALLVEAPLLLDPEKPENGAAVVNLPMGAGEATVGTQPVGTGTRILILHVANEKVLPAFVADWLNSSLGRESRRRAFELASSGSVISTVRTEPRALSRLVDEVQLPIPPLPIQEALTVSGARLDAVSRMVERARHELWDTPGDARTVVSHFEPLFDKTLTRWVNDLPYPVASALWTLESKRYNVDAAHKQMFLVWEAYAAFTGTVLLSALGRDPALREAELPLLRDALSSAHLTMERATLGSWSVMIQRLAACFRSLLDSEDPDERARVLQMFGSPSPDALGRLVSPVVVQLIADTNAKRNMWDGHTGAVPEEELGEHLAYMNGRVEELRDQVGSAWSELQLVRAGEGSRRKGQIIQKVELAIGPNTPFRQGEIPVGELMESGELYLAAVGAAQPLKLAHLMVLRRSPNSARYSCYFYNRMHGSDVRLVSYHLADRSELTEQSDDVSLALRDLLTPPTASEVP